MKILSRWGFKGKNMAYSRKEEGIIDLAYPLEKVWAAISKALVGLGWTVEFVDDAAHRAKAKTKTNLMSWGTEFMVGAVSIDKNNTSVSVVAETPVTTVTALVYFGQTRKRIEQFLQELQEKLS
jgi:hypothetical protein